MAYKTFAEESVDYHRSKGKLDTNGKIGVKITKSSNSLEDLCMAYIPGVAYPCQEIEQDSEKVYKYTNKANSVAIITNGTSVLGFGDIGHLASKPVMEGKALLFKKFSNVDAIDIEVKTKDVDEFVATVANISDTFGAINIEDIKAPECFEIERKLDEICSIPVYNDDQHGASIVATAGLINVLDFTGKLAENFKVIILGAGAAAIASAKMYRKFGIKNIYMFDSRGLITANRENLNKYKKEFVQDKYLTLEEAINGSDLILGFSVADIITEEMVASMAAQPAIFACANPRPEINPELALSVRDDLIIGTGNGEYRNHMSNALVFPYIFRGALDMRAKTITDNMKIEAAKALAEVARLNVPYDVKRMHSDGNEMSYGERYIIPSIFDKRVMSYVAFAVAKAAVEDGVSNVRSFVEDRYSEHLKGLARIL